MPIPIKHIHICTVSNISIPFRFTPSQYAKDVICVSALDGASVGDNEGVFEIVGENVGIFVGDSVGNTFDFITIFENVPLIKTKFITHPPYFCGSAIK